MPKADLGADGAIAKGWGRVKREPYGCVPIAFLQAKPNKNSLIVYIALSSFQGTNESCFPRREQIVERSGLGKSLVSQAIGELVRGGWLIRKKEKSGRCTYKVQRSQVQTYKGAIKIDPPSPIRGNLPSPDKLGLAYKTKEHFKNTLEQESATRVASSCSRDLEASASTRPSLEKQKNIQFPEITKNQVVNLSKHSLNSLQEPRREAFTPPRDIIHRQPQDRPAKLSFQPQAGPDRQAKGADSEENEKMREARFSARNASIFENKGRITKMKKLESFGELKRRLADARIGFSLLDDICLAWQHDVGDTLMFDDRLCQAGKNEVRYYAKVGFAQVPEDRSELARKYRNIEKRKRSVA